MAKHESGKQEQRAKAAAGDQQDGAWRGLNPLGRGARGDGHQNGQQRREQTGQRGVLGKRLPVFLLRNGRGVHITLRGLIYPLANSMSF